MKRKESEHDDFDDLENQRILFRAIIEVLGKPKEHVDELLREHVSTIKEQSRYEIAKENFAEPESQGDDVFSAFCELEIWANDTPALVEFCFDFLPSSIEVIEPDVIVYSTTELMHILNDMVARLLNVEREAKTSALKQSILEQNGMHLLKNCVKLSLRDQHLTVDALSSLIEIPEKDLKIFLESFVKQGIIQKNGDKYTVANRKEKGLSKQG